MYKIYGVPTQHTRKVLYAAANLELDYSYEYINLSKGEHRTEQFMTKTPAGKVPVLEHDGKYIFESGAIVRYLANINPSAIYPSDAYERSQVDAWLDYIACHLGRWLSTLYFQKVIKTNFKRGAQDQSQIKDALHFIPLQFKQLDAHLEKNQYLTGVSMTLADICAWAYIEQIKFIDISLTPYKYVKRWFERTFDNSNIAQAQIYLTRHMADANFSLYNPSCNSKSI
jgi:glutathione S-transferase